MRPLFRLALPGLLAAATASLAACGLNPITIGPADLDTTSPAAPRCADQQYPFYSRQNWESGTVVVAVSVRPDGSVADARLEAPSSSDHLNAASLAAARSCRFATSTLATPRSVKLTIAWDFVGQDDKLPTGVVKIGVQPSQQAGS